jgi:hypothetical protein
LNVLFGDLSAAMKKFMSDNSLKFSMKADLMQIFKYYNDEVRKIKDGT